MLKGWIWRKLERLRTCWIRASCGNWVVHLAIFFAIVIIYNNESITIENVAIHMKSTNIEREEYLSSLNQHYLTLKPKLRSNN